MAGISLGHHSAGPAWGICTEPWDPSRRAALAAVSSRSTLPASLQVDHPTCHFSSRLKLPWDTYEGRTRARGSDRI